MAAQQEPGTSGVDLDAALEADEPNIPERLATPGAGGVRAVVTDAERLERRQTLSTLMATPGVSQLELERAMSIKFGMTPAATQKLRKEIFTDWTESDAADQPHRKARFLRVLERTVRKAETAGQYNAVANILKTQAQVEGLLQPVETRALVQVEHRVVDGAVEVINQMPPEQRRLLIEQEMRLLEAHKPRAEEAQFEELGVPTELGREPRRRRRSEVGPTQGGGPNPHGATGSAKAAQNSRCALARAENSESSLAHGQRKG